MEEIRKYETVSQCLRSWMTEQGFSSLKVAEMAGWKSKTSVVRILKEAGEEKTRVKLVESMSPFWSPEWRERFERALRVSRMGADYCAQMDAISRGMLSFRKYRKKEDDRMSVFRRKETVCILGAPWRETLRWVDIRLAENPDLRVIHFVTSEEILSSPEMLEGLLLKMETPAYSAELVDREKLRAGKLPWNICFSFGTEEETDGSVWTLVEGQWNRQRMDRAVLRAWEARIQTLKAISLYQNDQLRNGKDYITFLRECYRMERGKRLTGIRLTPGLQMIPFPVIKSSVLDFLAESKTPLAAALDTLLNLQEKRCRNFFEREQETLLILSGQAVKESMKTGRISDQFFASRPFTKEETGVILRQWMRFVRRENVRVLIWEGKEQFLLSFEVYQGNGVLVYSSRANYSEEGQYRELFLPGADFERLFTDWIRDTAETKNVVPAERILSNLPDMNGIGQKATGTVLSDSDQREDTRS